jgi:hypothetical protein
VESAAASCPIRHHVLRVTVHKHSIAARNTTAVREAGPASGTLQKFLLAGRFFSSASQNTSILIVTDLRFRPSLSRLPPAAAAWTKEVDCCDRVLADRAPCSTARGDCSHTGTDLVGQTFLSARFSQFQFQLPNVRRLPLRQTGMSAPQLLDPFSAVSQVRLSDFGRNASEQGGCACVLVCTSHPFRFPPLVHTDADESTCRYLRIQLNWVQTITHHDYVAVAGGYGMDIRAPNWSLSIIRWKV